MRRNTLSSIIFALSVVYFYNPLNDALTTWNGAISDAAIKGVSINQRIMNFYLLIAVLFPAVFIAFDFLLDKLSSRHRTERLNNQAKVLFPVVVVLYLIRFWNAIPLSYKFIAMAIVVLYQLIQIALPVASLSHVVSSEHTASLERNASSSAFCVCERFTLYFIGFWLCLLVFYFFCPVTLPAREGFSSIKGYIISGVLKNKIFLLKACLCAVLFFIVWIFVAKFIKDSSLFNLACIRLIPILFAFVAKYASLPLSTTFEKFIKFTTPLDSCNPLVVVVSVFVVLFYVRSKIEHTQVSEQSDRAWETSFFYYLVLTVS